MSDEHFLKSVLIAIAAVILAFVLHYYSGQEQKKYQEAVVKLDTLKYEFNSSVMFDSVLIYISSNVDTIYVDTTYVKAVYGTDHYGMNKVNRYRRVQDSVFRKLYGRKLPW